MERHENDAKTEARVEEDSALDRVRAKRRTRKRKKAIRRAAPVVALCVLLAVAYAVGYWYFKGHYYPGTIVGSVDASLMQRDELAHAIDEVVDGYAIAVQGDGLELSLNAEQVGVNASGAQMAQDALSHMRPSRWPLEIFSSRENALAELPHDQELIAQAVAEPVTKHNEGAKAPTNASMKFNEQTALFEVVDEVPGTLLDQKLVGDAVCAAVGEGREQVALDEAVLVQPQIKAADAKTQDAVRRANEALDRAIPLQYEGTTIVTPTHADMVDWLGANDDLSIKVRKGLFAVWADQAGIWESVDHNDDQNDYVLDGRALAGLFEQALNSGTTDPVSIPTVTVAKYSDLEPGSPAPSWDSSLGRYLDVDIPHQMARLYSATGDVIWESKVTTGNVARGDATPPGTFNIFDKKTDFVLLGDDKDGDGEYDYNFHVDYWMPFNEGIGLHDASWRSEYGGDHYLEEGSGGCVNLPKAAATALFSMIHIGDTVVVRG
ncbi:MAG: L,D-transpeptidase [Coriobacteriales bacterium]|nr:L,D-transpeptidase [Coriobacteriales bacterium]